MEVGEKEEEEEGDGTYHQMDSFLSHSSRLSLFFQYVWDTDQEYLFRAMVAFSMRKVPNREATE
jgi:hypothetical protein